VDILILQVFVSLLLVVGSVLLFAFTCRQRSFDHADRLALLPVEDDGPQPSKDPEGTES
jgi:hypothetical protein